MDTTRAGQSLVASKQSEKQQALAQMAPELITFVGNAWMASASRVTSALSAFASNPSTFPSLIIIIIILIIIITININSLTRWAGDERREGLRSELAQAELCKLCLKIECSLVLHLLRAKKKNPEAVSQVLPKLLEFCKTFVTARTYPTHHHRAAPPLGP
jgi:hypothetical protein